MSNDALSPTPPNSDSVVKRVFRFVKRTVIVLFVLVFIVIGAAIAIGYYHQNEIKSLVITELNKNLNTEIIIDGKDIDFTVLKSFPLASIDFVNVKALDATTSKNKDTLFKAHKISLLFNIIDIYNKNYHIKKIIVDNVDLNIKIDKQGNDNFHFWKTSSDTSNANFKFALKKIVLKHIRIKYKNNQLQQKASVVINNAKVSGKFSNENYSLEILSDLLVNSIKVNNTTFLRQKNIHINMVFNVDKNKQLYEIKKGNFKIEDVLFEATGKFVAGDKASVNIGVKGKELDIQSALSLVPDKYKEKIHDYKSDGEFYFNSTIKGAISNGNSPSINADFGIKNTSITHTLNNIVLENVNLNGNFTNGKNHTSQSCILTLKSFNAKLNNGLISGELMLKDFDNLFIEAKINANIALEELQHFTKFDTIETVSGQLKLEVLINGKWNEIYAITTDKTTTSGTMNVENVNLKIKNNELPFTNINGNFNFDNNNLVVTDFSGNIANSDFRMNGVFKNILGFLFKENQPLVIKADLNSKNIDLNQLLQHKEETISSEGNYKLKFSEHIDLNLNSSVDHLIFRKFEAKNIKGNIVLRNKKMLIDSVAFSTMDGSISASGIIDGSNGDKLMVDCISDVKNINITKMFTAFENFGQTNITDKNISGVAHTSILLKVQMNDELKMNLNTLYSTIDMTIDKGELKNVEALKSLSKFISLNELMNLKFATLKNQIEIKNKMVIFPKMEINSNALNLTTSGTHSFENEINYKIKLSLDELLGKKAKRNKKENEEFGQITDDDKKPTNIFLSMTGTVEHPIIKYDKKEAVQQFKENFKAEKQTAKSLLKEEFGIFKKDTSLTKQTKKEEQKKFNIEWEEHPKKKEETKELKAPPKKNETDDF